MAVNESGVPEVFFASSNTEITDFPVTALAEQQGA
jgi:hypothetical protein